MARRHFDGEPDAIGWFADQLAIPVSEFVFAEAVSVDIPPRGLMEIGRCELVPRLNSILPSAPRTHNPLGDDGYQSGLITRVHARDETSAVLLANDQFDESRSLMAALGPSADLRAARVLRLDPETEQLAGWSSEPPKYRLTFVDRSDQLWPGYRQLSAAMRSDPADQTEWERRVIAATRWHHIGRTTPWIASELAAYVGCLESLALKDVKRGKAEKLVVALDRVDEGATTEAKRARRKWLMKIYSRRSDAVHEGIAYRDELDISRLRALSGDVLGWAIRHLDPWHRGSPSGPCTTLEEAHEVPH